MTTRNFFLALLFICQNLFAQTNADSIIVIKNVTVWDGMSDTPNANFQVLVIHNLIKQVGRTVAEPKGTKIIDGKGKFLMPGLTDAHLHLMLNVSMTEANNSAHWAYVSARATKSASTYLMQGFTTIRDMGGPVFGIKEAIDEGTIVGPRIYPSGAFISQTSGHGDLRNRNDINPNWGGNSAGSSQLQGYGYLADGRPQVLNAVRENLRQGATQIKMMAGGGISTAFDPIHTIQFTTDELEAGVQAAADWGTYVSVHAYQSDAIQRALRAGVKCIEHGHLIDDEGMKLLKEKNAFIVPQSYWVDLPLRASPSMHKFKLVQQGAINEMELAKKYNVKVAFGTDVFGNVGIEKEGFQEFTSRLRWYKPIEILRQTTSLNAELFAMTGKLNPYPAPLGVIKEGAYADLLIYDGNPIEDIKVITKPDQNLKLIMKNGRIYKNEL
jgi:imidazolonepropionase-like amidohydrolase